MLVSKECFERGCSCYDDRVDKDPVEVAKRQWVGLTDEEMAELHREIKVRLMGTFKIEDIYRAIEAKLKEKNHEDR